MYFYCLNLGELYHKTFSFSSQIKQSRYILMSWAWLILVYQSTGSLPDADRHAIETWCWNYKIFKQNGFKESILFFFFFKTRCMLSALEMKEKQLWSLDISYRFHWESTSSTVIKVSQIVRKPKISLMFFFRSQLFPWRALLITSLPLSSHILEGTCSQLTSKPTNIKCWRTSLLVTPWQAVQARIWMGWDRVG